jgi:hypothetical protein
MDHINIEPTKFTPKVFYDANDNSLEISGFSLPENVNKFYSPLITWLSGCKEVLPEGEVFTVKFQLAYYNSGSLRALIDIMHKLVDLVNNDVAINILWYYDDGDIQILESGKEISEIVGLPFKYIINP